MWYRSCHFLNQLIEEMNQLVGLPLPVSYQKERDGDIKYSLSDSSALKGLGFSPVYSIQEGLQNILSLPIIPKIDKRAWDKNHFGFCPRLKIDKRREQKQLLRK